MPNMIETMYRNMLQDMEANRVEREAILAEAIGLADAIDRMDRASVEYRSRREYRDAPKNPE